MSNNTETVAETMISLLDLLVPMRELEGPGKKEKNAGDSQNNGTGPIENSLYCQSYED